MEATWDCQSVTPTIFTIKKEYLGSEQETATGPNFIHKYKITLDVAAGQAIGKPLTITDCLPNNMAYEGGLGVTAPTSWIPYVATQQPPTGTVINPNGDCLVVSWPNTSVTGVPGPDATVEFNFSIRDTDADGNQILQDCIPVLIANGLTVKGKWTPQDPRDSGSAGTVTGSNPNANQLYAKCMAIQKSVQVDHEFPGGAAGPTPGDILKYTLNFQVSDYKSIGNLVITDHLSDGQTLVAGSALVTATDQSGNPVNSFLLPVTSTADPSYECLRPPFTYPIITGGSKLVFDVSSALTSAGHNTGILIGGWTGLPTSPIPAQGTIVFKATIDDQFVYPQPNNPPHPPQPNGDPFVDKHDPLTNCVTIDGNVYPNTYPPSVPTAPISPLITAEDDSSTAISIVFGRFQKSVYAIKDSSGQPVCGPAPAPIACGVAPQVHPGDAVTFRLTYNSVPSSDTENMQITDWLPLPVFDVKDFDGNLAPNGTSPQWGWTPASPTSVPILSCAGPNLPAPTAGVACALPGDSFTAFTGTFTASNLPGPYPHLIVDQLTNSLKFDYGPAVNDPFNAPRVIDVAFTIVANAKPFADGLSLTNEAQECETNTFGTMFCQVALAPITMREPKLKITKGAIATNNPLGIFTQPATPQTAPNPTAQPPTGVTWLPQFGPVYSSVPFFSGTINHNNLNGWVNSDLSHVDANDVVTFAIVIENQGGHPAYNVQMNDLIPWDKNTGTPTCFAIDPNSIHITDGAGNPVLAPGGYSGPNFSFLLTSPLPALTPSNQTTGSNIVVITFNVTMNRDIKPGCCDNTATLTGYAASADVGAPNFVDAGVGVNFTDSAAVCVGPGALAKCIVGTSEPSTTDPYTFDSPGPAPAAIGEIVRYRMLAAVPEGVSPSYQITDFLPQGLSYVAGSARFGFYSNGGIASTLPLPNDANFLGPRLPLCLRLPAPTAAITPAPVTPLPLPIIGGTGSGGNWVFDFGTLTNNDNDPGLEFAVVDFSAQVLNIPGNQGELPNPTSLPNSFQVCAGTGPNLECDTSAPVNVDIVEPKLIITKEVKLFNTSAATVAYAVTITNTGTATAFDVNVLDVLPACLTNPVVLPVTSTPPNVIGQVTNIPSLTQLSLVIEKIPVGTSVTITYIVSIVCQTCADLINTVKVTWTSLPGLHGTNSATPGLPGTPYGERDDSTAPLEPNNYSASATTTLCRKICAYKFNDVDGNGAQNGANETALAGWTFNITGGNASGPQTTDATGLACWNVLASGTYTITEVQQTGWVQTTPTTPTPPVTITQPGNDIIIKFGNHLVRQVCDLQIVKTKDVSAAGLYFNFTVTNVGAAPCPGPITITDPLPSGAFAPALPLTSGIWTCSNVGNPPLTTISCTTNGAFNPGDHSNVQIQVTTPGAAGLVPNCATVSTSPANSDVNPSNNTSCVDVQVCAFKFNDLNRDGQYTTGEPALAGWTFHITAPGSPVSKVTDAQGRACFTLPRPGNYAISEIPQTGWVATTPTTQNVSLVLPLVLPMQVNFGNRRQIGPWPWDWVLEYYNTDLNHYFLTIDPAEAAAIDAGAAGPGWQSTGQSIAVYDSAATAPPGAVVTCRFYGNQANGGPNGHFYTAEAAECAQVRKDPGWTFERNEFYVMVPVNSACPGGGAPVYRVYNGRFAQHDSNHRYTTDLAIYDQMDALGWTKEGVVFCGALPDSPAASVLSQVPRR